MNDCYACVTQRYNCRHSNVELFTISELLSVIADDVEGKETFIDVEEVCKELARRNKERIKRYGK